MASDSDLKLISPIKNLLLVLGFLADSFMLNKYVFIVCYIIVLVISDTAFFPDLTSDEVLANVVTYLSS